MIEASWLRAFAVFASDANLSRTARALHLSQPAVHAQLKRLAEAVGVPLYRRAGRGLALTPAGIEVAAFAREAEEKERELVSRVRGDGGARDVVLAAGTGALLHVIGEGVRAFTRLRAVRLEVLTRDAAAAEEAVRAGLAHVGVAAVTDAPRGMSAAELTAVGQVLVLPRAHPLAKRRRVRLAQLTGERLVLPPEGRPQRVAIDLALRAHGARVTLGASAQGWDLCVKLAELGLGLAIVNACCKIPRGMVARPLPELDVLRYVAFTRSAPRADAARLVATLVAHGEAWRRRAAP